MNITDPIADMLTRIRNANSSKHMLDKLSLLNQTKIHVIRCGKDFSADVCMSLNNSISKEFAAGYR